ncbi:hypothetical protein BD769DRAFT_1665161 [Suillus cothurnatus]|nr:hypothetical protein BD769DRAFT_1665161 [Suillus cothurnatus]
MDSIIEHNHVLQFAEPLGAFMQMEVDHSSSSSLESPNHDIDMDSSSSSRPGYQEDGDIALDDGTEELDFGFYPSSATTASSVDTDGAEPLDLGIDISSLPLPNSILDVSEGNSILDDGSDIYFGLHSSGGATANSVDTEGAEPLNLGMDIRPLPLPHFPLDVSCGDSMSDDGSELDFGLHPSGGATAGSVDTDDTEPLDFGIDTSPPSLPNSICNVSDRDSPVADGSELDFGLHPSGAAMTYAYTSSEYEAGPLCSIGLESSQGASPPGGISPYTPTRYRHLPAWASQRSLLPAVNEFNKNIRRRETLGFGEWHPELLSLPGAPTDDPIPGAADLYEFLTRDAGQARSSPSAIKEGGDVSAASGYTQPPHEVSSQLEDLDIPLSEEELLKISRSVLTLGRSNAVATGYACKLVNEVADGDEEQVHPTLQEILEAERPFHVAYLEATDNFRKTLHDVQRAVRLHDQTLQLQAQLDAMIAAVEAQEQVFG